MTLVKRRLIAAGTTLACCAILLWVCSLPSVRTPEMAFYWFCACLAAVIVTRFVGYGDGDE